MALFDMQLAAERLEQPRFIALNTKLSTALRQRILRLRSEVQFALGNYDQGFKALVDLTKTLKRKKDDSCRSQPDMASGLAHSLPVSGSG